uniref:Uncharacterized protein n=1 Tax=Rangifer tarandus platyrhynchus TaxID=3082113 RepID=A0ACB0ETW1_RANTA|nr:unnamed protein product [Rangifer tarandus platyrhynchus]
MLMFRPGCQGPQAPADRCQGGCSTYFPAPFHPSPPQARHRASQCSQQWAMTEKELIYLAMGEDIRPGCLTSLPGPGHRGLLRKRLLPYTRLRWITSYSQRENRPPYRCVSMSQE